MGKVVIKEPKNIGVFININYEETDDNLIQKFSFSVENKKYLDYLFDARFLFKQKIENIITDNLLNGFQKRVDEKNCVSIYYDKQDKPRPIIKKIQAYTPPYFGCLFCKKAKKKDGFVFCEEKNKHYVNPGIKRCPVFRCKEEIIT